MADVDVKEMLAGAQHRMEQGLEALKRELAHLRAGRASTGLVEHIKVHAYGSEMPLNQVAAISAPEATTLLISPYDKSLASAVEKAINMSDLGLMPQSDGSLIRINVPPLTEDRRNELLKVVSKFAEEGRVALRNVRRDINDQIKKLHKSKEISEDEMHVHLEKVDKVLDEKLGELDKLAASKQKEITDF
jgi:ribosome recycling factor